MKSTDHMVVQERVISLDVMRGMIMLFLCAESCLVFTALNNLGLPGPAMLMIAQFFHHPWHGLRFWDLVQPAFMFMAGAALYISYSRKLVQGITWTANLRHILIRSFKLLLFGLGLHCIYAGKPVWELWNVLTQLAFTTIITYLLINKSVTFQVLFSVVLLIGAELMYRYIKIPGFDQSFVEHHNFGAYMDTVLMGKINPDGWVAINFIPTAAHTIWGSLSGRLLVSNQSQYSKVKLLLLTGFLLLLIGFGLDINGITPIIKRISTSSFVFASGGWVLIIMAAVYWIADLKKKIKYAWVFSVMGMNAIFIYIFFETVGLQWLNGAVAIFTGKMLQLIFGFPEHPMALCSSLAVWFAEWWLCYWLYRKKIFFKI